MENYKTLSFITKYPPYLFHWPSTSTLLLSLKRDRAASNSRHFWFIDVIFFSLSEIPVVNHNVKSVEHDQMPHTNTTLVWGCTCKSPFYGTISINCLKGVHS